MRPKLVKISSCCHDTLSNIELSCLPYGRQPLYVTCVGSCCVPWGEGRGQLPMDNTDHGQESWPRRMVATDNPRQHCPLMRKPAVDGTISSKAARGNGLFNF